MKKKIGIGSISLLLVVIAFLWAFEINSICIGDSVLAALNIPTWSDMANASGIHYTVFYAFIFLIPSIILSVKFKNDLFAVVGKWSAIVLSIVILLPSILFMVV